MVGNHEFYRFVAFLFARDSIIVNSLHRNFYNVYCHVTNLRVYVQEVA